MKTLNENVNRMLNLMGSNKIITHNLINEQSAAWESVPVQGGSSDSKKVVNKNYNASYSLIDPRNGLQFYIKSWDNQQKDIMIPVYVGATIVMVYDKLGKISKTWNESKRFLYYFNIFLSYDKDATYNELMNRGFPGLSYGSCRLLATNSFYISTGYNREYQNASNLIYSLKNNTDTTRTTENQANINRIQFKFKDNPVGYCPDLIKLINTDLDTYGYPQFPKTLDLSGNLVKV